MPTGYENQRTRRERIKTAGGSYTKADIATLRAGQSDRCPFCDKNLEGRGHIDHMIPISRGGDNSKDNLQILCDSCNCIKGIRILGELYEPIGLGLHISAYMTSERRAYWLDVYRRRSKEFSLERRRKRLPASFWGNADKYKTTRRTLRKKTKLAKSSILADVYVILYSSTDDAWLVSEDGDRYSAIWVKKTACDIKFLSQPEGNRDVYAMLSGMPKWLMNGLV